MWYLQIYPKGWLTTFDNMFKFLDEHKGESVTIKFIEEWTPTEPKELKTRKEREAEPKEPIPLSRIIEDDNDH